MSSEETCERLHGLLDAPGGVRWSSMSGVVKGFRVDNPSVDVTVCNVAPKVTEEEVKIALEAKFCKQDTDLVEKVTMVKHPTWDIYMGQWSVRLRLKDRTVLSPFIHRDAIPGRIDAEIWHIKYAGQDDMICYRCLQPGHGGRFCSRAQSYAQKARGQPGDSEKVKADAVREAFSKLGVDGNSSLVTEFASIKR